jgi:alanine racemase
VDVAVDAQAIISLRALSDNYQTLKALAGCALLAPIKANGYGHGAVAIAKHLEHLGVAYLGVATVFEALELRQAGVVAPILLLTASQPSALAALIEQNITLTVSTLAQAEAIAAAKRHYTPKVHLKINTGLNRLGAEPSDLPALLAFIAKAGCELEGVYTHLIDSEDLPAVYASQQVELFSQQVQQHQLDLPYIHYANTGALLNPALLARQTLVRPGIGLYGYHPGPDTSHLAELTPVMTLKSWVTLVKTVATGAVVSYNALWQAKQPTHIATVRMGYADGYKRGLTGKASVLIAGQVCPIVGRICMDQLMVDIADLDVAVGDPVTLFGPKTITAETLANLVGTNSYEILTSIGPRVERVYQ